MRKDRPTVYIITHCRNPSYHVTNLLALDSVRIGYPNFDVAVVDNGSCAPSRLALADDAETLGYQFSSTGNLTHADVIRSIVLGHSTSREPVVILDSDVRFWASCADWNIDGLFAGRLIPTFHDEVSGCIVHARLHPSHLVIPRPDELYLAINALGQEKPGLDLISPMTFLSAGKRWERHETTGLLYSALSTDAQPFDEKQLDCFDHLGLGTQIHEVAERFTQQDRDELLALHHRVRAEATALRGDWRRQEAFYQRRAVSAERRVLS